MANIIGGSIGAGKAILNDYTLGVEDIDGGHRLTITRGSEVQTMDVLDGKNGADGKDGAPGADGRDGIDGKDGAPGAVQTVNGEAPDENGNVQVSGLPDGASANQQLATDREGVVKWEEKPFYYFQDTEVITWDGDTTGRNEIPVNDTNKLYHVSNTIYPPVGIIGNTFTVMRNGVPEDIVIIDEMFMDMSVNLPGMWQVAYDGAFLVTCVPSDYSGYPAGLYFLKTDSYYVSSLSLNSTVLKEIDPIYLPAIPAEKLPEIPAEKLQKQYKISINPDNSCSVSFTDAYNMVNSGSASFSLVAWGDGKYMQISYISNDRNISGTIQRAIIAELIHIRDSASRLSIAELVWGESSGISVTIKTISAQ